MQRRTFLKSSLASSALLMAAGAGLLKPTRVLAADWNKDAFGAKDVASAVKAVFGTSDATDSDKIKLKAPALAENGAVVPIKVSSTLADVNKMAIVIEKNGTPLAAVVDIASGEPFFSARVKMGKTSPIIAYVMSGGKLYKTSQEVKVTVGGCGG
ncbi:MAG: thiosulfate oxidation carrier protein SoxY [Gammaproteobacteria bacterium]|nr:MAG: thiosulfate oxidation carrier protein SoxY [Gammaproteobacteria bacterium]